MKRLFAAALALSLSLCLRAQDTGGSYSPDQLDQLLAPIALYPDPLVALILPASTVPADVTSAAAFLAGNGAPSAIDAQAWDPSVKGLAHYPAVVKWMNDNLEWTQSLGAAFAMQPSDVMKSVQQLRAKARAAGTLTDTPQQKLDVEDDDIRIVPAQDDTIYVPEYDPNVVYDVPEGDSGPYLTFSAGYPVGLWLGYQLDWDDFGIWMGPWHRGWDYRREWADGRHDGGRWHVDPRRGHELVRDYYRPRGGIFPAPRPIAGARLGPIRPNAAGFARSAPSGASRPDYRGYGGGAPRPSTPAPSGPLYGGYNRGTQARDYSNRGQTSRQAPVRSAPQHSAPARSSPGPSHSEGGREKR